MNGFLNPRGSATPVPEWADLIAWLIRPIAHRLGRWNLYPTSQGVVLAMSEAGLGDALFLPQALGHGGLVLRRIRSTGLPAWDNPAGAIVVGDIQQPAFFPATGPPSWPAPLAPEQAAASHYSLQIHLFPPRPRQDSTVGCTLPQGLLDQAPPVLTCQWWPGVATHQPSGQRKPMVTVQAATRASSPLTPYVFEAHIMPLLHHLSLSTGKDGLLVMFDNPSTNYMVYCQTQTRLVTKGSPCVAGHQHPA